MVDDTLNELQRNIAHGVPGTSGLTSNSMRMRKEKSLGLLSQRFIQLLLEQGNTPVGLDDAANRLLSNEEEPGKRQTKVRRLYDIANILTSLKLIQKTPTDSKKPGFRWCYQPGGFDKDIPEGYRKEDYKAVTKVVPPA